MHVEIVETPGKDLKSSDYNSRHSVLCDKKGCQICRFASQMETIGDRITKISILDIENGLANMPFTQHTSWLNLSQKNNCSHHLLFCPYGYFWGYVCHLLIISDLH